MKKVVLYEFESCPYCQKVRSVLEEASISYEKKEMPRDRSDPQRLALLEKSGVATLPVLEIDGKFIGESERIIGYIKRKYEG